MLNILFARFKNTRTNKHFYSAINLIRKDPFTVAHFRDDISVFLSISFLRPRCSVQMTEMNID